MYLFVNRTVFIFVGNCDFNALSELRNLKSRIEELESEIRERDEEVRVLKDNAQQKLINGEETDSSKVCMKASLCCFPIFRYINIFGI